MEAEAAPSRSISGHLRGALGACRGVWRHAARLALDIAPRAVVMDRGRIVYDGASETLRDDPAKLEQLIGVVKA